MYIRNIIALHQELNDGEEVEVYFRSGRDSRILKSDILNTLNGDLQVTRTITKNRCIMVIDSAEVERIILRNGD